MVSIAGLFVVEMVLGLPVLSLVAGAGAGQLHGFSGQGRHAVGPVLCAGRGAVATAMAMALMQRYDIPGEITLFGVVSAACFFVPGLKYYRQRSAGSG